MENAEPLFWFLMTLLSAAGGWTIRSFTLFLREEAHFWQRWRFAGSGS